MKTTTTTKVSFSLLTVLKVSFTIVGTLIGAGFASGKEITTFFGCYGNMGYIFIVLFCIVFAFGIIYFSSLKKESIPKPLQKAINIAICISEIISITAMMAGLSSILSMLFINNIPFYLSLILIFLIIICGVKGLTTTNLILIPILFISIVIFGVIGATSVSSFKLTTTSSSGIFKLMSFPLYIGLNLFSIFPIALEFGRVQTRKERLFSAILSSAIILVLMFCFCTTILNVDSQSALSELPLVIYILTKAPNLTLIVVSTLAIAIITTIISDGFVVRGMLLCKGETFANIVFAIIFVCAYFLSNFGFAQIVETFYPINGLLGLLLLIAIVYINSKNNKHKKIPVKI